MIDKNIEDIVTQDIQNLITSAVVEWKTIEYKLVLPDDSKQRKKEFLADISSFANASGGDVVFGIGCENGIPSSLVGVTIGDQDQEVLRLESIIRDGIEPRITIATKVVSISDTGFIIIIRIPKSWNSPHRVKYDGHNKFYSRSSNGKYELDIGELRAAFTLTQTVIERIKDFRLDRISKLSSNETPVPFKNGAKILLHLIPISSFNPGQNYNLDKLASKPGSFWPIGFGGCSTRYNLEGFLSSSVGGTPSVSFGYAQLYRNGIIEAVDGLMLDHDNSELYIPNIALERELIKALEHYLSIYKLLEVELPVFVFVTFIGVKGYYMPRSDRYYSHERYPIERAILILPEVMVENYDIRAQNILKPAFDAVWNACGFPRDLNYNADGEWAPRG